MSVGPQSCVGGFVRYCFFLCGSLEDGLRQGSIVVLCSLGVTTVVSALMTYQGCRGGVYMVVASLPLRVSAGKSVFCRVVG